MDKPLKQTMEEEMSRASANLSAEERGQMISQHEDDMKKLEQANSPPTQISRGAYRSSQFPEF